MTTPFIERRVHARISTLLDAQIEVGEERTTCRVRDLSLGGALVESDHAKVSLKQAVVLTLPPVSGRLPVVVPGKCVRFNMEAGVVRYGLQWNDEVPDRAGLIAWLKMLGSGDWGGDRRGAPRVRRRLEVSILGSSQCQAVLEDISRGGMAFHCRDEIPVGDQVTIELVSPFGALSLKGEVVRCRSGQAGVEGAVTFSAVGNDIDPALKRWLDRLLLDESGA